MYVVDASVWVSRFLASDEHHEVSRRWLGQLVAEVVELAGPALLLPEVAGAISRQTRRPDLAERAVDLLQRLPNVRLVPLQAELAQVAALLAGDLGLRGADAVYVSLAHRLSVPLVTWDREQQARAGSVVRAETPARFAG